MKYLFTLLLLFILSFGFSQASSSSDFQLKVNFDFSIDIDKIQPFYFLKNGNVMEKISYQLCPLDNSIIISGYNDFILWVSFPALCFTLSEDVQLPYFDGLVEQSTVFYLVTKGALSSYTGKQHCSMTLSRERRVIIATLLKHNHENVFENIQLAYSNSLPDDHTFESMIKVNKLNRTSLD